ncbi:polysaccharide deacetylase family sporulation protein PdaB [Candidatus Contubernalis alkalaceticus]|nr:polysaccharide deacetylase family sporulation protein PdaB [Candidatus Contubernalis alkalaceticus]
MKTNLTSKTRKKAVLAAIVLLSLSLSIFLDFPQNIITVVTGQDRLVPIYYVETPEKKVAISFDACWGAEYTPKILEVLRENDLKTTFFLTGFWLEKYPDMVKQISEEGHEIGNHTYTHPHLNTLSEAEIKSEIEKTHRLIKDICGQEANLFRPPFGEYSNKVIKTLDECGYKTIQWSVDSLDWKEGGKESIVNRVTSMAHNGAIILFHNNGEYTAEALPEIIEKLTDEGFTIVPISELLYSNNYYVDPHSGAQKKKE